MNLTAAVTITVYIFGLANISENTEDKKKREVVVPLATTSIPRTPPMDTTVNLEAHQPDIVIKGVSAADCGSLGGTLIFPGGKCRVAVAAGTRITLPQGTPAPLDASAHTVPKLTGLCPAVTGINSDYLTDPAKYAVRLTLNSGTLDTCANGKAWASRLVLTADNGRVTIGTTTVTLADGATMHIRNTPATSPTSGKEHFWWHYVIANGATACTAIPMTGPTGDACEPAFAASGHPSSHDAASGLGCSNSQYP